MHQELKFKIKCLFQYLIVSAVAIFLTRRAMLLNQKKQSPWKVRKQQEKILKKEEVSIGNIRKAMKKDTTYEFSTSNPMWRASLETLDFLPLTTVDYLEA